MPTPPPIHEHWRGDEGWKHEHWRDDESCRKQWDRISHDRSMISELEGTKHDKALRWFRDDLRTAESEGGGCRR